MILGTSVFAILAAITIASAGAQAASGVSLEPSFDWSGAYVGINAGVASSAGKWNNFDDSNAQAFNVIIDFTAENTGFVGGGQIGYNHQIDALVLGIEGNLDYLGVNGKNVPPDLAYDAYLQTEQKWLGSIVGRLGYATDRIVFFGTGGIAFTSYDFTVHNNNFSTFHVEHPTDERVGWTAGVGMEYAMTDNLVAGIDFKHYDFGWDTINGNALQQPAGPGLDVFNIRETDNTITARLNYKF